MESVRSIETYCSGMPPHLIDSWSVNFSNMKQSSSVYLLEDHQSVRQLLRAHLEMDDSYQVVGEAGDGETALADCMRLRPDVVVVDLLLRGMKGLEVMEKLRSSGSPSRFLVFSSNCDSRSLRKVCEAGAGCVVEKTAPIQCFMAALSTLAQLDTLEPHTWVVRSNSSDHSDGNGDSDGGGLLSNQEKVIVKLVAAGLSSKDIASELGLSARTVSNHRYRLMRKLGARNAVEMIRKAQDLGAIS